MAHGYIIQLNPNKEMFVDSSDFIATDDFYENTLIWGFAYGMYDNSDRRKDLKFFASCLEPYTSEGLPSYTKGLFELTMTECESENFDASIIFREGFKEAFFRKRFEKLQKKVLELTIDEFLSMKTAGDLSDLIYCLCDNIYICDEYLQLMPLDKFVRRLPDEGNFTYYIGGTVEYHY